MIKQIRVQSIRIGIVYILLGGLVTWQWHFVHTGIQSNPFLNWAIIGVFAFGSFLALRSMISLRDETRAFAALQEVYADVQSDRAGEDPLQRHERCFRPGVVFTRPRILGHVFELTLDELLRTKHMRISIATMQNLLGAIDAKAAHDRALIHYITGLLVFLGLIGTFIGLMEMVASVGGIIGSLANADNASSDSIKRLIHELEAPLVGMATGFSASLFGLFTSLVLGLVMRFASSATHAVKEEFEAWLANISQLETEASAAVPVAVAAPGLAHVGHVAPSTATALLSAIRRTNHSLDRASSLLRATLERQGDQIDALQIVTDRLERVTAQQANANSELSKLDLIRTDIEQTRADLFRVGTGIGAHVDDSTQRITHEVGRVAAAGEQRGTMIASARSEVAEMLRGIDLKLAESFETTLRSIAAANRDEMTALRSLTGETVSLHNAFGTAEQRIVEAAQRNLATTEAGLRQVNDALASVALGQATMQDQLRSAASEPAEQLSVVARSIEGRLALDLADVGRVLDGISRLLSDTLSQIAAQQAYTAQAVAALPQNAAMLNEIQELRRTLDEGISSGLGSIAGAVEAAFRTYVEIADKVGVAPPVAEEDEEDGETSALRRRQELQSYANERWARRKTV